MLKPTMDIKALQLASRFSLPPNSLGYCGKGTASEKLKRCFISGDCTGVEEELTKFIVLHPYLKTIATITDLPLFSYPVIESYCLGNGLLKKVRLHHYEVLLDNFLEQGVPKWFVKELRDQQPKIFIPHHLFQVLHVGVGKASGAVPFNIKTINQCMIRWGKAEEISNNRVSVNLNSLEKTDSKYNLTFIQETLPFSLGVVPNLKSGDTIAVHWKQVIKILTKEEIKNLSFWTKEVIKTMVCSSK